MQVKIFNPIYYTSKLNLETVLYLYTTLDIIGAINGKKDYRDIVGELPVDLPLSCTGRESQLADCPGANEVTQHINTCQISDNAYVICQGMNI